MKRIAVIKQCQEKDIDPDRPRSEQKYCLYTHDGSRLLGRHPTKESAINQEQAIKAQSSKRVLGFIIKYLRISHG